MDLRGKNIAVTGGAGFIGSHTARALVAAGATVAIIDRLQPEKQMAVPEGAKLYSIDLTSEKLENVLKEIAPDTIFHFASHLLPSKNFNAVKDAESVLMAANLLESARKSGVSKFVFASSGAVYGAGVPVPTPETQPINPETPYALSKYVAESYLRFYRTEHGLPYVVLRYPNVYGPGQTAGALADYIKTLRNGLQAEIRGDGEKTRDYIYIDDVVAANLCALQVADNTPDPIFNVGTGTETSLNLLYRTIAELLGKEAEPIYVENGPGEQLRYSLDPSKFEKLTGWKAKVTLREGLQKVLDAS